MEKEKLTGSDEEERALWRRWIEGRNPELRNELFFFYSRWARMAAGILFSRYPHPPTSRMGGLSESHFHRIAQCHGRFELQRGTQLKIYAEHYIKGSVLKGLACYIQDSAATAESRASYVAESLETDGDAGLEAVANSVIDLAFGYLLELGIIDDEQQQNDPFHLYTVNRDSKQFEAIIRRLPVLEQRVIFVHYYHHLSFTEISNFSGVSKSIISQIRAKALVIIKEDFRKF